MVPCNASLNDQLLWKQIEQCYDNGRTDDAIQWCQAALHGILGDSGSQNVGKIERYEMDVPCSRPNRLRITER